MRGSSLSTDAGHEAARNDGVSYDDTFLPPTMTFAVPAEEKYATPAPLAALAALAIGPFWKNGSLKYETSSTMTSAWLTVRSVVIWFAKSRSPLKAVANARCAPGARSCTSCAMARPSSAWPPPAKSDCTTTGAVRPHGFPTPGRSPVAMSVDACVGAPTALSNESERTPTVSPDPSTPCAARAVATFMSESASEIVGAHTPLGATAARRVVPVVTAPTRGEST